MFQYLVRRLLFFIPSLFIIAFLVLWLSNQSVDDPVDVLGGNNAVQGANDWKGEREKEQTYWTTAQEYHLNLPIFYFNIQSWAYNDSLNTIVRRVHQQNANKFVAQYGNGQDVWQYYKALRRTHEAIYALPNDSLNQNVRTNLLANFPFLYIENDDASITNRLKTFQTIAQNTLVASNLSTLSTTYQHIKENAMPFQCWLPTFRWHGTHNRYHLWLAGIIKGDFGLSYRTQRPVLEEIKEAIGWTILLNLLAVFFTFGIAVPLGVYMAAHEKTRFDRWSTAFFFGLHTMPLFWLATVVMIFFTSDNYGLFLFARPGLGDVTNQSTFLGKIQVALPHFIAPVCCITLYSIAYLSQQMRSSMLSVLHQDYIRTARMKGLSLNKILWKHAFRNALFPIITLFASVFPEIITGSLVIEAVFNLPGMGSLAAGAVADHNIPIVLALVWLTGIMTLIGYLVSDVLYRVANPIIRVT
jgi:peptide/nickel transport system permease protein